MKRVVAAIVITAPVQCPDRHEPATQAAPAPVATFSLGPSARDRFEPEPPRASCDGRVYGGHPWGPAGPLDIVWLRRDPEGGWTTRSPGDDHGDRWDPALGWVCSATETRAHRASGIGGMAGLSDRPPPRALLGADTPIEDVRCEGQRWTSGAQTLCRTDAGLELFDAGQPSVLWDALPEVEASWSPDGQRLVWTDHRRMVLWDAEGGGWAAGGDLWAPILTADGSLVVALSRSSGLAIFDARDGVRLDPPRPGAVEAAVLGPNGEVAVATSDRALRTWDADGRPLGAWTTDEGVRHLTWGASGVCWSSRAARCATPTGEVLARFEVPADGFGFGTHRIAHAGGELRVDGRPPVLADPVLVLDPSGDAVGLTRDGEAWTLDLSTGELRAGFPDDVITGSTVARGGRTLTVRPDGGVVVR